MTIQFAYMRLLSIVCVHKNTSSGLRPWKYQLTNENTSGVCVHESLEESRIPSSHPNRYVNKTYLCLNMLSILMDLSILSLKDSKELITFLID